MMMMMQPTRGPRITRPQRTSMLHYNKLTCIGAVSIRNTPPLMAANSSSSSMADQRLSCQRPPTLPYDG